MYGYSGISVHQILQILIFFLKAQRKDDNNTDMPIIESNQQYDKVEVDMSVKDK